MKQKQKLKLSKKTWIFLFSLFSAVCAAAVFFNSRAENDENKVVVYQNGEIIKTLSLNENTSFTVDSEDGYNIILIENGRVCIKESDCSGQDCVNIGWLSSGGLPIVCAPHKLLVAVQSADSENSEDNIII